MTENHVYLCEKVIDNDVISLQLKTNKKIFAEGSDIDSVKMEIYEQILTQYGDGEAVLEILENNFLSTGLSSAHKVISYNDSVRALNSFSDLYEGGCCNKCSHPIGKRNQTRIELATMPEGAAIVSIWSPLPRITVFSKCFLKVLPQTVMKNTIIIPVNFEGKECGYYEIILSPILDACGIVGATYPTMFHQSWECSNCKRRSFVVRVDGIDKFDVHLNSEHYSVLMPLLFAINVGKQIKYAIHTTLWNELLSNKKLKGLVSDNIVLLKPSQVDIPILEQPEKFEW